MSRTLHTRRLHDIALLLFLYGAIFSISVPAGGSNPTWIEGGLAVVFFAVGAGVWFAREWARWPCGVLALLLAARNLALLSPIQSIRDVLSAGTNGLVAGIVGITLLVLLTALWVAIGYYCLRPSTRMRFAEAREAMAGVTRSTS